MGSAFDEAIDVRSAGGGSFTATLDETWNLRPLPQGGIITAIAVQAMAETLDDREQRPRTLHTTFAGKVAHGDLEIDVDLLRRGRTMSHLRAEARNPGAARGHLTTCIFGGERDGFSFTDLEPPMEIPAPDDCRSFREPPPPEVEQAFGPMPFWDQLVEGRAVLGHAPWEDYEPDRAESATWYRFDEPPMAEDQVDSLGLIVLADTMPGAVGEKIGRVNRPWFAPSVDLTVHLLDDWRSPWVLAHNRARYAGNGYASTDMALWDCGEDGRSKPRLVAYATQLCLFTFLE